ncbi:MAG: DUF4870 domain-containing protein [Microbacteriaceae bacterium]|nr:DUF4870 domain-containing protein [Microbacteriaceae bacterium]
MSESKSSAAGTPLSPSEDIQWGSFAHLFGFLSFPPALIIWLVFKDRGRFTNVEAKEALNFQIFSIIVYVAINILASIPILGFLFGLLLFPVFVVVIVFSILGYVKAKDGQNYRYPVTLRLIR